MSARNGKSPDPKKMPALFVKHGSLKGISRATGITYSLVQVSYAKAVAAGLMSPIPLGGKSNQHITAHMKGTLVAKKTKLAGKHRHLDNPPLALKKRGVTRFLFTSAQNNTELNEAVWTNLLALKEHYGAELHVSYFSYIKNGLGARGDKASWVTGHFVKEPPVVFGFDSRLKPYASNEPRQIADGLVWCGEQNIIPTAARPLSSLESMTGRDSAVIPHVKTAMESVAASKGEATKFLYTTGTVTKRNYIMRKEGRKASFHHSYGALLIEVDENQNWYARQILANEAGTLHDLDVKVSAGQVTTGNPIEAIAHGDVHVAQIDKNVARIMWGKGGMLDTLKPKYQFFHDVLDFYARNHHEIEDEFSMLERHARGMDSVRKEVEGTAAFFALASRPWCKGIVVNSNHDRALAKWLRNRKAHSDPVNLRFRSAMRDRMAGAIEEGRDFIAFKDAYLYVTGLEKEPPGIKFLAEDEKFIICNSGGNGIEMGMHGDRGPNGGKGSRIAFTKMGRRAVIGHSHSAGITDGVYQTGTCSIFDVDYAKGPSSWSHSHVIVYPNGKRAVITMWAGKWRA